MKPGEQHLTDSGPSIPFQCYSKKSGLKQQEAKDHASLAHRAALQSQMQSLWYSRLERAWPSSQIQTHSCSSQHIYLLSFLLLAYIVTISHTHLGNYRPSHYFLSLLKTFHLATPKISILQLSPGREVCL